MTVLWLICSHVVAFSAGVQLMAAVARRWIDRL